MAEIENNINSAEVNGDEGLPKESYLFGFSPFELEDIYIHYRNKTIKNFLLFLISPIALFLMSVYLFQFRFITGLVAGVAIGIVINSLKSFNNIKKTFEKSIEEITKNIYEYRVYDNYLIVTMRQNDEIIKIAKVYFKDIEQKFDAGSNLYIAFRNQTIILKKSGLSQGSVFYSL